MPHFSPIDILSGTCAFHDLIQSDCLELNASLSCIAEPTAHIAAFVVLFLVWPRNPKRAIAPSPKNLSRVPSCLQIIYLVISKNSLKNETSNEGWDLRMSHNIEKFCMSQKATVKIFSAHFGFGFLRLSSTDLLLRESEFMSLFITFLDRGIFSALPSNKQKGL